MSTFNLTHPSNLVLSVVTGSIGALGLPGNIFLTLLILSDYKKRRPHEWLLFSLAANDFFLCLNNAVLEAPFINFFDRFECKVAAVVDYICGTISFLTPPLVAYNRYLSLYDSQRYVLVFTNFNILLMSIGTLLFGVLWVLPFAVTDSVGQDDLGLCGTQAKSLFLAIVLLVAMVVLILSYVVLLFFSYKVINKIRDHKKQAFVRTTIHSRLINESQELITVMLLISVVPMFAQIPPVIVKMLQTFLSPVDPWLSRGIVAAFPLTSATNAYITLYIVKAYRRKVTAFFGCHSNTVATG